MIHFAANSRRHQSAERKKEINKEEKGKNGIWLGKKLMDAEATQKQEKSSLFSPTQILTHIHTPKAYDWIKKLIETRYYN